MGLRKPAADIKGIYWRKFFLADRADFEQFGSPVGKGLQILRVIKLKC